MSHALDPIFGPLNLASAHHASIHDDETPSPARLYKTTSPFARDQRAESFEESLGLNINTFPLALSQSPEGKRESVAGRFEAVKDFAMRSRVAQRPTGQDSFAWPRAARHDEPPLGLL